MTTPLQTTVNTIATRTPIKPDSHLLLLGSCFTDSIGQKLILSGIDTLANPFGTLYNPYSIAKNLSLALDGYEMGDDDLVEHDGLWHSWLHHSRFSAADRQQCIERCNWSFHTTRQYLEKADHLIVTFGTAYFYQLAHTRSVVSNCHKVPAAHFIRQRLNVNEIVDIWKPLLERIATINPQLSVVFTVSPIRHLADGAHENQLSKSTLHLSVDQMIGPGLAIGREYFPAYEIMMDELRDYRFYERDMAHPSDLAIDIIWQRFQQAMMETGTIAFCDKNIAKNRQLNHRPIIAQ